MTLWAGEKDYEIKADCAQVIRRISTLGKEPLRHGTDRTRGLLLECGKSKRVRLCVRGEVTEKDMTVKI
jgi:hypothetical protein